MSVAFQESYYGKRKHNQILTSLAIKFTAPIVFVDTSKQNDESTVSMVDVNIEIDKLKNLSGISDYCILIHDCIVDSLT